MTSDEERRGAPPWAVTFADMALIMLSFFVLLASFAKADQGHYQALTESIRDRFGSVGQLVQIAPQVSIRPDDAQARGDVGRLTRELRRQIDMKLLTIERQPGRIAISIRSGGAFPSGSVELTPEARAIVARIAQVVADDRSRIVVEGHTDNVPLADTRRYRDNWELAAARAASIVRELSATGLVAPGRLEAASLADTRPVATNRTLEGRQRNRRVVVRIAYDKR